MAPTTTLRPTRLVPCAVRPWSAAVHTGYRGPVLTADVRFEGWTAEDWLRLVSLWKSRRAAGIDPAQPVGGLFVVHDSVRVRKILHTHKGRLPPTIPWPAPLEAVAASHDATWVIAGHLGALDEVMERFGARARRSDELTTQALSLVGIVREMLAAGALERWPQRLHRLPMPNEGMVRHALDSVCANGRTMALGMFREGELWTAFVGRRRGAAFDVIVGPDELRPAMGMLSGDWRRDYRHLVRAVEERYAPLSLGCFGDVDAFRQVLLDEHPGAFCRAVALRDVVVSPIPLAVGFGLGFDGVRLACSSLAALASRVDPFDILGPAMDTARQRLGALADSKRVQEILGFDPIAALRTLLRR